MEGGLTSGRGHMRAGTLGLLLLRGESPRPDVGPQLVTHLPYKLPSRRCRCLLPASQRIKDRGDEQFQILLECLHTKYMLTASALAF